MGKKSSNKKENKLSGSNIIATVVTIVIAIVLLLVLSFFIIMDGIVNLIFNFAVDLASLGVEIVKEYFVEVILQEKFQGTLRIYKISGDVIAQVQNNLESSGIDAEACGLTPVRIRKMLMAEEVSSSLNQTLCLATVTEEEILENVRQKEKYRNVTSLNDFLNKADTKNSKDIWTENYDYTLYYDSKKFFYFKDKDNIFGEGENQWYLGAMGVITLKDYKNEDTMVHGTREDFEKQKSDYEDSIKSWIEGDDDFAEDELKCIYTEGASDEEIIVWNIVEKQKMYNYDFENTRNNIQIKEIGKDESSQYEFKEQTINIADELNTGEFVISMELMMDLLDMTSSGEFLETFIDYALSDLEVTARLYQTTEIQTEYKKEKFNIPEGFILEVYDFIDVGNSNAADIGDDNFAVYGDIVYKRKYSEKKFETSVPDLLKKEGDINYNLKFKGYKELSAEETKEYLKNEMGTVAATVVNLVEKLDGLLEGSRAYTIAKNAITEFVNNNQEIFSFLESIGDAIGNGADNLAGLLIDGLLGDLNLKIPTYYTAWPLEDCLKLAYDPGDGFVLGEIVVEEKTKTRIRETSCEVALESTNTWYGDFCYSEPEKSKQYFLAVDGEEEVEITKDEYNNFGYSDLEVEGTEKTSDERLNIHASYSLAGQYSMGSEVHYHSALDGGTDLMDEIFERQVGYDNMSHYDDWTTKGLSMIAEIDKGEFNDKFSESSGTGKGADYVYVKYARDGIEKYKIVTKIKREVLNRNSIQRTTAENSMLNKLNKFLGLLKNDTGEIPNPLGSKMFDSNGQVVMYGDIYKGKIPAGDLLLDNGAEMLFELLGDDLDREDDNTNTDYLVNIFKYLAYLYTGTDYGITDINQLTNVFNMNYISGVSNSDYWYPVGSESITTLNGKQYASGTPLCLTINSPYGYREAPITGEYKLHEGVDLDDGGKGSGEVPIIASKAGIVTNVVDGCAEKEGASGGYGNRVFIKHEDGFVTVYAHLYKDSITVSIGDYVEQGQVIAKMGSSGYSTGTHLHFEVRDASGNKQDPMQYISNTPELARQVSAGSSAADQTIGNIKYVDSFARKQEAPTQDMIERTIISKTTCYDLCYFCCEKTETDPKFGVTASGMKLSGGERIVAADTNVIPMGTWIYIENAGYYMVADRGGAINGTRIDIFMGLPGDKIGDASGGTAGNPGPGQTCWNAPGSYRRVKTGNNVKVHILKQEYWPQ